MKRTVSKEEFYRFINPLDCVLVTVGPYPYTTIFELRNRREVGRIISAYKDGHKGIVMNDHYLTGV